MDTTVHVFFSANETCPPLRATLMQALDDGTLEVASLLAEVPLTSLNDQLNNFAQNISNSDIIGADEIVTLLRLLNDSLNDVINECGLNSSDADLQVLLEMGFDDLLQDFYVLFGSVSLENFFSNIIVFRADRPNFEAVNTFLDGPTGDILSTAEAPAFNLSFHENSVQNFLNFLSGQPLFFAFLNNLNRV